MAQTVQIVDPASETRPFLGIAPEAWKVLVPLWLGLLVLGLLLTLIPGGNWLILPLVIFGGFAAYFFRDPLRIVPQVEGIIVSPADGTVLDIREVKEGLYVEEPSQRISIFMSVFNVHINRVPTQGTIEKVVRHPGKFHMAMVEKASLDNEQTAVHMQAGGHRIVFVQIAGWVARRIVNHLKAGDEVKAGTRCGLIRFGSRVDVYLPLGAKVLVKKGDKTRAGESVMGWL